MRMRAAIVEYLDRKSTRLNSSHDQISYAVFCLKKKKKSGRMGRRRNQRGDSQRRVSGARAAGPTRTPGAPPPARLPGPVAAPTSVFFLNDRGPPTFSPFPPPPVFPP